MNGVGIVDLEVRLPSARMTAEDMARRCGDTVDNVRKATGVREKPVLAPGESPISLGIEAARALLERNELTPNDVHLVIYASCVHTEKTFWSPAAKVQKELGAPAAFAFDILNGCNSGNLALHLASSYLAVDPAKTNALVVVGDALSPLVDYSDREQSCIFAFADAASAVLLRKGEKRRQLLAFAASTNATFADHMRLERGDSTVTMNDDRAEDIAIVREYRTRYPAMIHRALDNAGLDASDVAHLFMNQGDHKLIDRLADSLALPAERIYRSHERFGHLGGSDVFFGLRRRLDTGEVKRGEVVVLASSAIGFSWGATVLRA